MNLIFENPTTSLLGKLKNISLGFVFLVFWNLFVDFFLKTFPPPQALQVISFPGSPVFSFFSICILAPLWEEAVYRHLPLRLARWFDRKDIIIAVAVVASIIFGLNHLRGEESILRQGVMGLVLCSVYIKNGYDYKSSVFLHFLWNLFVFLI